MNKVIVCDIDGTIADVSHRLKWTLKKDASTGIDWDYFQAPHRILKDLPFPNAKNILLTFIKHGFDIFYLTGRPRTDEIIKVTQTWMQKHGFPQSENIQFKPLGKPEYKKDTAFKQHAIDHFQTTLSREITLAFDDLERVVEMYKLNNIPIFQIRHLDDWIKIEEWIHVLWR
ncbi:MAG: HAD family acid phosphatase [Candidatus Thorarchaeota archaeon]